MRVRGPVSTSAGSGPPADPFPRSAGSTRVRPISRAGPARIESSEARPTRTADVLERSRCAPRAIAKDSTGFAKGRLTYARRHDRVRADPRARRGGPRRSRIGISRLPWWGRRRIGLLLLALILLPWPPISGPPWDATPARRFRGVGDIPILAFVFAPDGATIATIQCDWTVALRNTAGGVDPPSFLDHGGQARALAFSPDRRSLAGGATDPISSCTTSEPARPGISWGCRSVA
jgi:hypothetical protein